MKTFILVALIFAPASSAHAVTRTWTGNGSDNFWSTAANWSPSGAHKMAMILSSPGRRIGSPQSTTSLAEGSSRCSSMV